MQTSACTPLKRSTANISKSARETSPVGGLLYMLSWWRAVGLCCTEAARRGVLEPFFCAESQFEAMAAAALGSRTLCTAVSSKLKGIYSVVMQGSLPLLECSVRLMLTMLRRPLRQLRRCIVLITGALQRFVDKTEGPEDFALLRL